MRDLRATFAFRGVEEDEIVAVCDCDGRSVGERDVRDAFVRALVAPENLARRRVERAHPVRPARYTRAVAQVRELPARSDVEHAARENHLRRQPQIFRLPNGLAVRA